MDFNQDEIQWLKKIGFKLSIVDMDSWYKEHGTTIYTLRNTFGVNSEYKFQLLKTYDTVVHAVPVYGYEEVIQEGKTLKETLLPFYREEVIDDLLD